jgi:YHYH protein
MAKTLKAVLIASPLIVAAVAGARAHDIRQMGDGKYSNGPKPGYLYSCQTRFSANAPGSSAGPWIKGKTYDTDAKPTVDGSVSWPNAKISVTREGDTHVVRANNLPTHPTGNFPVSPSDDAFRYDRNPNAIRPQNILLRLPAEPQVAAKPSCVPMGMVGFTLTNGALFNAVDARGRDAPAYELMDKCGGHPQRNGQYHYHDFAPCLPHGRDKTGHSQLIGYALDGFGVYGAYEANGKKMTNADLDGCHGHVGPVLWDGEVRVMYHYHMNDEYPYSIGCFRGKPVSARIAGSGGQPPQGQPPQGQPPRGSAGSDPIVAIAREFGVDADRLRRAVGAPPPDIRRASRELGISERTLREAFDRYRPG